MADGGTTVTRKLFCTSSMLPGGVIQTTQDCITPEGNKSPREMYELLKAAVAGGRLERFEKWARGGIPVVGFKDPSIPERERKQESPNPWIEIHIDEVTKGIITNILLVYYYTGAGRTWIYDPDLLAPLQESLLKKYREIHPSKMGP